MRPGKTESVVGRSDAVDIGVPEDLLDQVLLFLDIAVRDICEAVEVTLQMKRLDILHGLVADSTHNNVPDVTEILIP